DKIKEINKNKDEIQKIQSDIDEINQKLVPLKEQFKLLDGQIQEKDDSLRKAHSDIQKSLEEKNIVGIAHSTLKDEITLKSFKDTFKEISDYYDDLKSHQKTYNRLIAPSPDELQKIEKLYQNIHDTQTRLQSIGLSIEATAHPSMSGEISLDDEKTSFSLKNNENISWTASQSFKVKIDQIGEFKVRSGSQDVQEMKDRLREMQDQYQELVAPYGTDKLNQLQELVSQKGSLEKEIERTKSLLEKKSDKSKEDLQKEIIASENKIKMNWDKIPDDSPYKNFENQEKNLIREELSQKLNQLQEKIDALTKNRNQLDEQITEDRKDAQKLLKIITNFNQKVHGKVERSDAIDKGLSRLEKDGLSQEEREDKLNKLSYKLEQKSRAWKVYQAEIEEKENQPLGEFEGLKNKVERLKDDIRTQELNEAGWKSKLQMIISQSMDTNAIEEKLEQLQNKEKELQTEADALKLLFELTTFYRENTIGELSEPIRKRVSSDLEKLLGPKYSLKFNKKMKPDTILANGEEAPIDLLSFGTQEQVWCLFRLALGNILSSDEKQLVVLDDPLVNTDPVRMHHALQILEDNAKDMQIIVVTCDVDKYNSLKDANFISMDAI
ncbi:MAG TPA: hypothetical protein GX531_04040, partial [Methanothermobacter sp.]|nr:hypothetical protein [Methanothermobacter sp.]